MQHDYDLANASGLVFRGDLNDVLEAIATGNSGTTAPTTTFPFMRWFDTTTGKLKIRNAANSAWIEILLDTARAYGGLGIVGFERLAKTATYTVANSDKGKTIACSSTPYDLDINSPASYDADFGFIAVNESTSRALRIDFASGGTDFWLYPGQAALIFRQDTSWRVLRPERWKLTGALTIYVDGGAGNDANDGLAAGSGNALATPQAAVNLVSDALDIGANQVTIQLADGTYTTGISLRPHNAVTTPILQGDSTGTSDVVISPTSNNCFAGNDVGAWHLRYMKLETTTSGHGILISGSVKLTLTQINFGAIVNFGMLASYGATILIGGNYTISGGAQAHYGVFQGGWIDQNGSHTVTLTGTPAFSAAFTYAVGLGGIRIQSGTVTFSGSATGTRYQAVQNSVIDAGGGGANYFPGDAAGSTASGGQYV